MNQETTLIEEPAKHATPARVADFDVDWYAELDDGLRFLWIEIPPNSSFRIDASVILGRRFDQLDEPRVELLELSVREFAHLRESELPYRDVRWRLTYPDGEVAYMATSGKPLFGADGAFRGYQIVGRDVTLTVRLQIELQELNRQLECRVLERTAELERMVLDLDTFALSVSHELRTPLRAIQGFARLVTADPGSRIGQTGSMLVAKVVDTAEQMNTLIDGVLAYSHASQGEPARVMVDVAAVVGDVLPGLSLKYPEVEFEMGEVGTANADPTMARQVFANLLDNAFKYCATMMRPRVTLSAGEAYGEAWFQIADNGTGIGARDGARIFQPFHKGRGGAEFSGRDIGLATVKRLIDRHGGRIGFESEAGKGATFRFTFSGQHVPVQVPDAGNKAVA